MLTALATKVLYREVDREQHSRLYDWAIWYLGRGFLRAPHRFHWQFEWKKEDAWIGAFWRSSACGTSHRQDVWICLLPCLPLHIYRIVRFGATRRGEVGGEWE